MGRVEVKVVLASGEVKHYEFGSVDLAIVTLGKMVGAPSAKRGDPAPAAAGDTTSAAASSAVPPAPVAPATPTRQRKPRADKGQPRGPYKAGATEAKAEGAGAQGGNPDGAPVGSPAAPQVAAATAPAGGPAAPAAAVPSDAELQAAVERFFAARGIDDSMALFSRFGVKRGRDLLPEQRAEYIAKVDRVIAGEAI